MNLADMIREVSGRDLGDDREEAVRSSPPEVLCTTLCEVAQRYAAGCRFKVGDLVTPRKGYNIRGEGKPFVVVDVRPDAVADLTIPNDPDGIGGVTYGSRNDVRCAHEPHGSIIMHWNESWQFEPYTGPGAND